VYNITRTMRAESSQAIQRWFGRQVANLWPVVAGSLSLRHSPCIRSGCAACAGGEGHASYVFYGRKAKRRVSVYVPERLVPAVQHALDRGRQLDALVREAGWRYLRALKAEGGSRQSEGGRRTGMIGGRPHKGFRKAKRRDS
jgi:hypothetical protein